MPSHHRLSKTKKHTMAGKASKKQAQSNLTVLRNLYIATAPVVALAVLRQWFAHRGIGSWLWFTMLHLPLAGCTYILDKSGRPRYDASHKLLREGMDLSQSGGLTEYMFDVIYLSLFGDVGKILFNTAKFWYTLLLVPLYACWKIYGMMPTMRSGSSKDRAKGEAAPAQSKRQAKLATRQDRVQVKYR